MHRWAVRNTHTRTSGSTIAISTGPPPRSRPHTRTRLLPTTAAESGVTLDRDLLDLFHKEPGHVLPPGHHEDRQQYDRGDHDRVPERSGLPPLLPRRPEPRAQRRDDCEHETPSRLSEADVDTLGERVDDERRQDRQQHRARDLQLSRGRLGPPQ